MLTKEAILSELRRNSEHLRRQYGVRRIGLFGSFARNEGSPDSDVDMLVELDEPTFDHYMDLKFFLEDLFHVEIDLVMEDVLKPLLRPYVEKDCVYA